MRNVSYINEYYSLGPEIRTQYLLSKYSKGERCEGDPIGATGTIAESLAPATKTPGPGDLRPPYLFSWRSVTASLPEDWGVCDAK